MGDGHFTLSSILLNSLLYKEKNIKITPNLAATFNSNSLEDSNKVSHIDRDREVQWLCGAGRQLNLGLNTVGLAIAILDRVLCVVVVRAKYINCVAVSALYLAVKLHEERVDFSSQNSTSSEQHNFINNLESGDLLDAAYLVTQLSLNYSVQELNRMERSLLRILNWDLMLPSCDRFLFSMLAVIQAPHLSDSLALRENYELVMSNWHIVYKFRPSILALSLLSLMLQLNLVEWKRITQSLMVIFKIDDTDLTKCRAQMSDLLKLNYRYTNNKVIVKPSPFKKSQSNDEILIKKSGSRKRSYQIDQRHNQSLDSENEPGIDGESSIEADVNYVLHKIINATQ